jgi:tRNA A-37 threonylcarbamoyl transferase component Bud32
MASLHINSRYGDFLAQLGLMAPEQFLALPSVIVSGHPDRHVARVTLGNDLFALTAFLKREHRTRWRDRLASARAGFGFVTRSLREARTLDALREAGVVCPEWLACGEDNNGRAFLLVRAMKGAVDLRRYLHDRCATAPAERRRLACRLGEALARIHTAGFSHPDLYSKHVFVGPEEQDISFLDWQRSLRRPGTRRRQRDLAALDATLTNDLVSTTERLVCLRAYLKASCKDEPGASVAGSLREWARVIRRETRRLLRKRHVREASLCPLPDGEQELLWIDGEALCVTPDFWAGLRGEVPGWLKLDEPDESAEGTTRTVVLLPGGRRGLLVRRRCNQPLRWLWTEFRRRPLVSPEVRQAGTLFRLQRYGDSAPRLLAFGQRRPRPWRTESFLLTECKPDDGSVL